MTHIGRIPIHLAGSSSVVTVAHLHPPFLENPCRKTSPSAEEGADAHEYIQQISGVIRPAGASVLPLAVVTTVTDQPLLQVALVFGARILDYIFNLCEGKLDYLERLSDKLLTKIICYLDLEDIARLSQTSSRFAKLCKSDSLWEQIVQVTCGTITPDMRALAKDVGWRQMFFTNKIQLQRQIHRKKIQGKQKEKQAQGPAVPISGGTDGDSHQI
ncbi:hypothetical protein STEG23_009631 [Scotinomys teguina]